MNRLRIIVKGVVQGVGFRPYVYNLARHLSLTGFVTNTSEGVIIEVEGNTPSALVESLKRECPPLAKIFSLDVQKLPLTHTEEFVILESVDKGSFTHVSPDISICGDCLDELFNAADRRFLYPFINCTNCGPRYSITQKVPYDRPNTTMSVFHMCNRCRAEYHDPANRRFHAQPNACFECGPGLQFRVRDSGSKTGDTDKTLRSAIEFLKQGAIIAIKGLGGFHLCCDATNREAVELLRERKRRKNKPFALMAPDCASIQRYCRLSDAEKGYLEDRRRPIVLLRKDDTLLPEAISPRNQHLGFMLPYTPLHYLLFYYPLEARAKPLFPHFTALVMTSGNLSEEPIVTDNDEAISYLSGMADAFVLHNRDIFMRIDDSVIRVLPTPQAQKQSHDFRTMQRGTDRDLFSWPVSFVRRSRGYVPEPIRMKSEGPDVLGCGADIKNTFTLIKGDSAIVSQHIGDMENLETISFFEETLANLKQVYRANPIIVAHDLHPDYYSTRWALNYCAGANIKSYAVQHHHAHIASVMAEHGLTDRLIGVALDGTGYGTDSNLWGGEFLLCDLSGFSRAAHFKYIPLPGGERAIQECWRVALSYLHSAVKGDVFMETLRDIGFIDRYGEGRIKNVIRLIDSKKFAPLSSGAGRLFDAVSALIGVCDRATFEGEAAIALESAMAQGDTTDAYPFEVDRGYPALIDFSPMVVSLVDDMKHAETRAFISRKFHNTIVSVIREVVKRLSSETGITTVALSGGVFQNSFILEEAAASLRSLGNTVYQHAVLPPNDGCISLGQAAVAQELRTKNRI